MASAAVLGCTSAVNLADEKALETALEKQWSIGKEARALIDKHDRGNWLGFLGALKSCQKTGGDLKACKRLERDIFHYDSMVSIMLYGYEYDPYEEHYKLGEFYRKFSANP